MRETVDRERYDWMADELMIIADEMRDVFASTPAESHLKMIRHVLMTVADHVSHTRGSGRFDLRAAVAVEAIEAVLSREVPGQLRLV